MDANGKERRALSTPWFCSQRLALRALALFLLLFTVAVISTQFSQQAAAEPGAGPILGHPASFQSGDANELMLDEPVDQLPVVDDARWSSEWTDETLVAVLAWVLMLVVLGIVSRPLARTLLGAFPDAGHGFGRIVLLLFAAWGIWFAASYELITFRAVWAWYAVIATAVLGWILSRSRFGRIATSGNLRAVGGAEAAFWIVFAVFLVLRFFNPDSWHPTWGGEKPMEFAHINALLRTPYFPAFDPWFSDGILNYYYYGEYLVAFLIKLTGIPSEIAFNLAQPTMLGLAASAMYSLVVAISTKLSRDRVDPLMAGGLAVVIFVLMGNLYAARDLLGILPDWPVFTFDWTWAASRAIDGGITEFPYFTGLYADLHAHLIALPITLAVLALGFALASSREAIGSSLLKLIALAATLGALSAANAWDVPVYAVAMVAAVFLWTKRFGNFLVRFLITILVAGATAGLAYLMYRPFHEHFVALFNDVDRVSAGTDLGQFTLHFGALLSIIGISMAVSGLLSWSTSKPRWRDVAIAVFCVAVTGAVALQVWQPKLAELPSGSSETVIISLIAAGALTMTMLRAGADAYVASIAVVVGVIGAAFLVALGWPVLAIGLILAACGALIFFSFEDQPTSYFGLILAAAGSVIAGVELIFVVDDLSTLPDWYRMNTIFKLYYQVWTLLSVLAAISLTVLISKRSQAVTTWVSTPGGFQPQTDFVPASRSNRVRLAMLACALLVGLSLVYPAVATVPRIEQRFAGHPDPGTLDALDWMRYGTLTSGTGDTIHFDGDLDAIRWFQDHVAGTPVIAEASIGPYRGNGSRFSIALGLPTVLGWDRHERQQRYYPEIAQRDADVRDLYDSGDAERKRAIIDAYGIDYIIVGDLERLSGWPTNPGERYASSEGIAAFETMIGSDLEIAFESNGTTVYRVIR